MKLTKFIVKQYDYRPIIKGNGFDGLRLGEDREEAEKFIDFINKIIEVYNESDKEEEE